MRATAPAEWGQRLSDRLRSALATGDFDVARRLALEGDGQARSLEKEYALMYKGLGITIRVLLELLGKTVASAPDGVRERAATRLADLLLRFRQEMVGLLHQAYDSQATREAMSELAELLEDRPVDTERELAATRRLLDGAEPLFNREQARLAEEVVRAIEAGDRERAGALVDRKERGQYVPLHDRFVRFMAEVFGWVLDQFGPQELYRFHRATAEDQGQGFEKWERLAPAEFAEATAFLLKQHMGQVEVREDAEKFTVVQTPCGSGGRLRLGGAYTGPRALPFVGARGPLTLGQERLPVYCSHCPIWNSVAPIEWFGRPHWVFEDASRSDGSCTLHIYKRRDGVPPSYYRQLGLAAPTR